MINKNRTGDIVLFIMVREFTGSKACMKIHRGPKPEKTVMLSLVIGL